MFHFQLMLIIDYYHRFYVTFFIIFHYHFNFFCFFSSEKTITKMLNTRGVYRGFLITTSIIYLIFVIFSFIAYHGGSPAFPMTFNQVSDTYVMEITPTSRIFILWTINVVYQCIWLIYCLVNIFRGGSEATIQSSQTIMAFLGYTLTGIIWLFTWTHGNLSLSLVLIVLGQFLLDICYGYACEDLHYYLRYYAITLDNIRDVWCHRMLIQNGIMFSAAWNTVWSFLTMASFFRWELGTESYATSLGALALLGVAMVVWFILENTLLKEHTQFTFSHYIVLVGSFISIHRRTRQSDDDEYGISTLVIGLLGITCVLLFTRLVILFFKSYERKKPVGEKYALRNRQIRPDASGSTSVKVYRSFTAF